MNPTKHKAAVLLGTAAMFGAAGCGASTTGSSDQGSATSSAPTAPTAQQAQPSQQAQPPGLETLASALGVTTAKLQAAMETTRPQASAGGTPGAPPSPASMAEDLAAALGLDEAKVAAALTATMPQGGPPRGAAPQTQSSSAQAAPIRSGQS